MSSKTLLSLPVILISRTLTFLQLNERIEGSFVCLTLRNAFQHADTNKEIDMSCIVKSRHISICEFLYSCKCFPNTISNIGVYRQNVEVLLGNFVKNLTDLSICNMTKQFVKDFMRISSKLPLKNLTIINSVFENIHFPELKSITKASFIMCKFYRSDMRYSSIKELEMKDCYITYNEKVSFFPICLNILRWENSPSFCNKIFTQVFSCLVSLYICNDTNMFSTILTNAPKLETLSISGFCIDSSIIQYIPNIKKLDIIITTMQHHDIAKFTGIKSLKLNQRPSFPNLLYFDKSLFIPSFLTFKTILPAIHNLDLTGAAIDLESLQIISKLPEMKNLSFTNCKFQQLDALYLDPPKKLESLRIVIDDEISNQLLSRIASISSITSLELSGTMLMTIVKQYMYMPNIKKLIIHGEITGLNILAFSNSSLQHVEFLKMPIDSMVYHIINMKSLRYIKCMSSSNNYQRRIRSQLPYLEVCDI